MLQIIALPRSWRLGVQLTRLKAATLLVICKYYNLLGWKQTNLICRNGMNSDIIFIYFLRRPSTRLQKCGKGFIQKVHLRNHELKHTGERPYLCIQCGKSFLTSSNLKEHIKHHCSSSCSKELSKKTFSIWKPSFLKS